MLSYYKSWIIQLIHDNPKTPNDAEKRREDFMNSDGDGAAETFQQKWEVSHIGEQKFRNVGDWIQ